MWGKILKGLLISVSLCISIPAILFGILSGLLVHFIGRWTKMQGLETYGYNLMYSLDQHGNALLLGDPDETISSRTGRAVTSGSPKWWVVGFGKLVDWLAWTIAKDPDHVRRSVKEDERGLDFETRGKELWNWIKR